MDYRQSSSGPQAFFKQHMGAEPQNSFKGVPRGQLYGKLTTRHHLFRYYVSPDPLSLNWNKLEWLRMYQKWTWTGSGLELDNYVLRWIPESSLAWIDSDIRSAINWLEIGQRLTLTAAFALNTQIWVHTFFCWFLPLHTLYKLHHREEYSQIY